MRNWPPRWKREPCPVELEDHGDCAHCGGTALRHLSYFTRFEGHNRAARHVMKRTLLHTARRNATVLRRHLTRDRQRARLVAQA